MSLSNQISFAELGDDRGGLISLESSKAIPFEIKRVYYIYDTQAKVARGFHAHKDLKQVRGCVAGSCRIILDDGKRRQEIWLDSPEKGLLLEDMIWREMHDFSPDSVLLVIASDHYNEDDYIRDYSQFKEIVSHA
jgi:hypothetical protein